MYSEFADNLKNRTKQLAINTLAVLENVQFSNVTSVLVKQLTKSVTSLGANYRSTLRAKSKADFISKISVVIEEADEALYWLELLYETRKINESDFEKLHKETNEILMIMSKTKSTTQENLKI
jgi:four helix bundle protein